MSDFHEKVTRRMAKRKSILDEREWQYGDSFGEPQTLYMDVALREFGIELTADQKKILMLAVHCDTKHSRIENGKFKEDSFDDLGNYHDAFTETIVEWVAANAKKLVVDRSLFRDSDIAREQHRETSKVVYAS